jgi:glycosyltransferase involved in cell wall biosynthesis
MRRIALIPVYNEEATLGAVLDGILPQVDVVVAVDDGSKDRSLALAREFAGKHPEVTVLSLPENRGMSAALREGFIHLEGMLREGSLGPDDLVLTLDADGQHDAGEIAALCAWVDSRGLDVALTRRDFSLYPWHKKMGNRLMTLWGRIWSGHPYEDVESGFRAMRLRVIPPLLEFFRGHRYSCAQEIAILTARLEFRVDNNFTTIIRLYRSQTSLRDVLINAALGFAAFVRWRFGMKVPVRKTSAAAQAPGESR